MRYDRFWLPYSHQTRLAIVHQMTHLGPTYWCSRSSPLCPGDLLANSIWQQFELFVVVVFLLQCCWLNMRTLIQWKFTQDLFSVYILSFRSPNSMGRPARPFKRTRACTHTVTPMEYFEVLIKLCICTVKRKLDSLEEHAEEKHKAVVIIIDCVCGGKGHSLSCS